MAGYYDPNKDYSLAIKQAKDSGASAAEISRLQSERQNKIDAKYGGTDPYKGKSDIMGSTSSGSSTGSSGSSGSSSLVKGAGYVTGGYTPGATYGTAMLEDNPYYKNPVSGSGADMSRRPDLAGSYAVSNGYTVFYDEDGYATKAVKGVVDYAPHQDINAANGTYNTSGAWSDNEMLTAEDRQRIQAIRAQMQAGQITGDQANQMANQIRSGYGYTIDKAGNVTDLGALSGVEARRQAWGLPTNGVSAKMQNFLQLMYPEQQTSDPTALLAAQYALHQGTYDPQALYTVPAADGQTAVTAGGLSGYAPGTDVMSFEDFLNSSGYGTYSEQTQAAIRAAVQQAILGYNRQIQNTDEETEKLARQAYIAKMLGQKNLNQQLSANGYAGGMADSQMIATETDYQNQLNDIEEQRLQVIAELQEAITQAQLSGDMQAAQELAGMLQTVQGQYVNYVQNQQQLANQNYWNQVELDNQNYWNQKNLDAQGTESAYTRALNIINSGFMPDSATLAAAGISELEARNRVAQVQSQLAQEGQKAAAAASTTGTGVKIKTSGGYNNGSLTASQVKTLQKYYGVTADGLWGSGSSKAAGGLTADQAWAKYQNQSGKDGGSGFSSMALSSYLAQGNSAAAQNYLDRYLDTMTDEQYDTAQRLLAAYGMRG